ncbi:MAG: hypothetical protein GF364_14050 [Candidatus Lokiarchaeota archaeon]|nr:hypothetical protein [Candidatus Lokiarchaeota archaeon]
MLNQIASIGLLFLIPILIFLIIGATYWKGLTVVPFNEVHVVSRSKKVSTYDGKGRYFFIPFLHGRTIIPKHVLDIEPELIKLHDMDNLPFGVEVSVKVQVTDPEKAAATLTSIDHNTVKKVVEDTVMSAARSIAMEREILQIMKRREDIEAAIYDMVADALSKLGLSAIIFDIKNIRDIENSDVISSLEAVKIAELRKNARISEATHDNEAKIIEVEKRKNSTVKAEQMKQEEEDARLQREREMAKQQRAVEEEKLKIEEQKAAKLASIARNKMKIMAEAEREKRLNEAKAEADAIRLRAEAESNAIKLKAEAEADGIRKRGVAEADVLKKKAEAMNISSQAGQIKMLEVLSKAQVESAGKIADSLGANNKIMYLPVGNGSNFMSSFMPKIDSLLQSGLLDEILQKFAKSSSKNRKKKSSKTKSKNDE